MGPSNFYQKVYEIVKKIPKGRVATYGQVAALIGAPRGAMMVGWAMKALPSNTKVPWQRVINSQGMISIENPNWPKEAQGELLKAEGVEVKEKEGNFRVDLKKYLWQPK